MIFVTVGTTSFEGLARAADKLSTKEKVVIQRADGVYLPENHETFEYTKDFKKYVEKADIVVTHGGAGTLFQLVGLGKKVVGVANNERDDLHQDDLLGKLESEGHIFVCHDLGTLGETLVRVKKFRPKKYIVPKCRIAAELIANFS